MLATTFFQTYVVSATFAQTRVVVPTTFVQSNLLRVPCGSPAGPDHGQTPVNS